MAPIDIVVLLLIGIAFVAVLIRIRRKGTCGDCGDSGSCGGSCSSCSSSEHAGCPACEGVDAVAKKLSHGLKAS